MTEEARSEDLRAGAVAKRAGAADQAADRRSGVDVVDDSLRRDPSTAASETVETNPARCGVVGELFILLGARRRAGRKDCSALQNHRVTIEGHRSGPDESDQHAAGEPDGHLIVVAATDQPGGHAAGRVLRGKVQLAAVEVDAVFC